MFNNIKTYIAKKRALFQDHSVLLIGTCFKSIEDQFWFEDAEQAIEYSYYWYESSEKSSAVPLKNGGYYPVVTDNSSDIIQFCTHIDNAVIRHHFPIVISNCSQSFTTYLSNDDIPATGIINISHKLDITSGKTFEPLENYLSNFSGRNNVSMLNLGVDENNTLPGELAMAQNIGINWVNNLQLNLLNESNIFKAIDEVTHNYDSVALNIDLRAIVRGIRTTPPYALETDVVLRAISYCLNSGKVRFLQLTGDTEELVFSRETKKVLDTVRTDFLHVCTDLHTQPQYDAMKNLSSCH